MHSVSAGDEGLAGMQALFRRAQLKALVDIHSTEFQSEGLGGGYLSPEEINIIRGALDMTEKKAFVGMTPLDKVRVEVMFPNWIVYLPFIPNVQHP